MEGNNIGCNEVEGEQEIHIKTNNGIYEKLEN